jgi:small subunit ribosomal protein S16
MMIIRTARGSKPLEVLGTFEPFPKEPIDGEGRQYKDVKLDITRAKFWLGTGAQPSDAAWRLLQKVDTSVIL